MYCYKQLAFFIFHTMLKYLYFAYLFFCLPLLTSAQYTISGKVLDAATNAPLIGANLQIKGTSNGAVTDVAGNFLIDNITQKRGYLLISYIGYTTDSITFEFNNQVVLQKNIYLQPEAVQMKEVKVEGRLEGQLKALHDQRVATNIKNVISAEQMLKYPDMNAAESIARIPGITLQRDQGEGRYVQLRGTPPELSNFSINGEQIPSPEGNIRYVALDVVPVDQLSSIEIYKALTPDLDGDAIGGTVNLITKTAKDTTPEIHAALAGGYNNLSQKPLYNLQFAFGQRYRNFGFYINASYLEDHRYSHNIEFDFNESRFGGDTTFRIHYDDIQLRHYDITRKRTGLSGTWDYQLNKNHVFTLNLIHNEFSDDETRRRVRFNIGSGFITSETTSREARIERDMRHRLKIHTINSANIGGKHTWEKWKVDYMFSLANAKEDIPDRQDINFVNNLVNISLDLSEPNFPRVFFPRARDSSTVNNYADYEFDELLNQNSITTDRNTTVRANIERLYQFGNQRGSIKFGGKIRMKEKERDNQGNVYSKYFQLFAVNSPFDSIRQVYNSVGPALSLATVAGDFPQNNLLDRNYELGATPDPAKSQEFTEFYFQNFKLQENDTKEESLSEDYRANEDIYAAYAMVTHYWDRLMFLAGVRYEHTKIDYQGFDVQFKAFSDAFERVDTLRSKRDYSFLLPQFHLKYSPNPLTNYRAAFTWTYSRPNFEDILPYRQSELDSREITQGNPELRFAKSFNIDLLAEKYTERGGLMSGGLFYKRVDDFVYYFEQRIFVNNISRSGWYFVTTAQNGLRADVMGAELSWNQQLYKLPGVFKYFGIYCNYTYTYSRATIQNRNNQQENISLPGQSPHALNFSLFFNAPKLYVKASANYNAAFLDELGIRKSWDVYYDANLHFDFNLNYKISKTLDFYLNALNLTNQPLKYYLGESTRVKQQEYYSWWGRAGFRLNIK